MSSRLWCGQAVGIEILGPERLEHLRQVGGHSACPVPGLMRLGQGREQIKGIRGGGRPPLCGDEMQIATGGGQVIMTEQFLECDQIDTCFQQMSSETVPERMDSAGLGNHRRATRLVIMALNAGNGYRTGTVTARKQPVLGMVGAPIVA